jgi:hypothetical protein
VDDDRLAPRLGEGPEPRIRVLDHEVGLEGHAGPGAAGGHDVGAEGQVGHEPPVHDVPLDAVDTGAFQLGDLRTETL